MSYVCLWSPDWLTDAMLDTEKLLPALLAHAPRIVMRGRTDSSVPTPILWADARGLHAVTLSEQLLDVLRVSGVSGARAGVALTPIAAEVAATWNAKKPAMQDAVTRSAATGDIVVRHEPYITSVRPGRDRAFVAGFPVEVLGLSDALADLLDGIGVESCGQLAALDAGSVEIRLGLDGVELWSRARADDARWLFRTPLRSLPSASFEWSDYALRHSERLLFVINSLLGSVCAALVEQGERARELSLVFSLVNRTQHVHPLRSSRPSADQRRWLRLVRDALDQLRLPEAVVGIAVRIDEITGNDGAQGDLFDRGFASADAVETTLAQLADDHGELIVAPEATGHPLADRRTTWVAAGTHPPVVLNERASRENHHRLSQTARETSLLLVSSQANQASLPLSSRASEASLSLSARASEVSLSLSSRASEASRGIFDARVSPNGGRDARHQLIVDEQKPEIPRLASLARDDSHEVGIAQHDSLNLTLQLLSSPRAITVITAPRRDHEAPVRYRDHEGWHTLVETAGPDRVSGSQWDDAYAREYFRCVREDGTLAWIYRGAGNNGQETGNESNWFLHGWWD